MKWYELLLLVAGGLLVALSPEFERVASADATCDNQCRMRKQIWEKTPNKFWRYNDTTCEYCAGTGRYCLPVEADRVTDGGCTMNRPGTETNGWRWEQTSSTVCLYPNSASYVEAVVQTPPETGGGQWNLKVCTK